MYYYLLYAPDYQLLTTDHYCYLLLTACEFLRATRCGMWYLLPATCYLLLATCYRLLATGYMLHTAR